MAFFYNSPPDLCLYMHVLYNTAPSHNNHPLFACLGGRCCCCCLSTRRYRQSSVVVFPFGQSTGLVYRYFFLWARILLHSIYYIIIAFFKTFSCLFAWRGCGCGPPVALRCVITTRSPHLYTLGAGYRLRFNVVHVGRRRRKKRIELERSIGLMTGQ